MIHATIHPKKTRRAKILPARRALRYGGYYPNIRHNGLITR